MELLDDEFFAQLDIDLLEIEQMMSKIDELCSWHDFLTFQADNLDKLEKNLDSLKAQATFVAQGTEGLKHFLFGVLWVGAVSAYEGAMHELFLNSLRVEQLQERIHGYCNELVARRQSLPKGMKTVNAESIRTWLTTSTISDPTVAAKRFDKVYGIRTARPPEAWCDQMLKIRNAFVHRNGMEVSVDEEAIVELTDRLAAFAVTFHKAFAEQVSELASAY